MLLPVAAVPLLVWGAARLAAPEPPRPDVLAPRPAAVPARVASYPVPPDVAELLRQGRNWRAARLLRERLRPDSEPGLVLLAARTEAAWGGWSSVRTLLNGKPWLSTTEQGEGWYLLGRAREEANDWAGAADAYGRALAAAPAAAPPEWRAPADLRHGLVLLRAGRVDEGVASLERLRARVPAARGWASALAAEALVERGDTARIRALVGDGVPEAPLRSQRARIAAYRAANDPRAAHAVALAFRQRAADPAMRAELGTLAAKAALALGDTAAARAELRTAMADAPASGAAVDAARTLLALPRLSGDDHLSAGIVYDRNGNGARAADAYRAWLAAGGGTAEQRLDVRMRMGRALFAAGRFRETIDVLSAIGAAPPAVAAEASYVAGRARYRTGGRAAAVQSLLATAQRFPGQPASADALYLAADLTDDAGDRAGALALYRRVAAEYAASPRAGQALMRLGGSALASGDWTGAAAWYDQYRTRYPAGDLWLQATYWAGRARASRGDAAGARQRWREVRQKEALSYYSVRAAERLGERYWPIPLAAAPADAPETVERLRGWMETLDLLRQAGLWREAEDDVARRVKEAGTDRALLYPLAEALEARGFAPQGIRIGLAMRNAGAAYDLRLARILYPFPYRGMVAAEARERGLDPFLVAALIRQESSFKPRAASRVGALGLMQVMPGTGAGMASGAGIGGWNADLLLNPEINVHLGIRFLSAQMRRYDGDLPLVFISYNAGPARANRWRSFPEFRDRELFTERIPFDETRDYVKILTRNMAIYRGLYGGS
ncbi:MAG TPA: transglycosylase SLT domain-containing protein [Longimicrobium sp.]|nr:transglycosylase SLT domain-containing protein [Longimicrobium sp.]